MFTSQRKMMRTTRNSQWRHQQQQKPYQSQGTFFQRNWKHHSTTMKARKMMELEKIMFYDHVAELQLKVVSNPLILKTIMSHMTLSDLKSARLVRKDWKKLSNLELGKRKCCKSNGWGSFESRLNIMRNSDDISWVKFDCSWIEEEEMADFASACGSQVKILTIYPCQTFWDLVGAGKFPNLEILTFCKDITKSYHPSYIPLKGISNPDPNSDSGDILSALVNLQRIEEINLSDASLVPSRIFESMSHLFKSAKLDNSRCSCCSNCSVSLKNVTALAQGKTKLERLEIKNFQDRPEFREQIYLILESSRESLCEMYFPCYAYNYKLKFSQPFQQLSTFHIRMESVGVPEVVKMLESLKQDCLPNLKTVKLQFYPSYGDYVNYYGSDPVNTSISGKLSSVLNLELVNEYWLEPIYNLLPSHWFPWLSTFFPNIQSLTIGCWKDIDQILLRVFIHWPKLTSLKIQMSYHQSIGLDPVLTGLSLEKSEELRKMDPENMKMNMMAEDISKFRTWPNLHSLKELKRLDIIFGKGFSSSSWCPVSRISCFYATNLHPELKVTIRFPERADECWEYLEPLSPYANLEGVTGNIWKLV